MVYTTQTNVATRVLAHGCRLGPLVRHVKVSTSVDILAIRHCFKHGPRLLLPLSQLEHARNKHNRGPSGCD